MKAALRLTFASRRALLRSCLGASLLAGVLLTATAATPASAAEPTYTGLVPARLLDTRPGGATIDGQFAGGGEVGATSTVNLTVLGRGGVPTSGVGAVAINVTVAAPTSGSFLTVYPRGSSLPTASNLNFSAGQTAANMAIVPVGTDGQISLYNYAGRTHLLVDVLGWFAQGAGYTGFSPARLLDTRAGGATVDGQFAGQGRVGAGSVLNLTVLGRGGVPASGVGVVAINLTEVEPTANSFMTVYPEGSARPNASNLNFSAGQTIANMVIVPVGASGQISLYNYTGQTDLLVDVLGWFASGAGYNGSSPARLLDTRVGGATVDGQFAGSGAVGPVSVLNLTVLGRGGVPASGVGAVAINLTASQPCASSFITAYPSGTLRPNASNLNFGAGQTVANMVIVPVGSNGQISLYNEAGETHLIVDVLGWIAGTPIAGSQPISSASIGCQSPSASVTAVSSECTALTNAHRAAAGLAPLLISPAINAAAEGHSQYQASINQMTHGTNPGARITAAGFAWGTWGENVAAGQSSCALVVGAWMNSSGHRANILNPAFTHIGIAVVVAPSGYQYWTMDLAAPA